MKTWHKWLLGAIAGIEGVLFLIAWISLGTSMVKHIADRFVIHFFSDAGIYLAAFIGFWYLGKFTKFDLSGLARWIVPAAVLLLFIFLREPLDVAHGGPVLKSYIDLTSHALGLAWAVWATRWIARHAGEEEEERLMDNGFKYTGIRNNGNGL